MYTYCKIIKSNSNYRYLDIKTFYHCRYRYGYASVFVPYSLANRKTFCLLFCLMICFQYKTMENHLILQFKKNNPNPM